MAHKMTLGETRRFAPCLPNELLSYFASLPIEYPGNGHPGVLFYRKDGEVMEEREGMVEMWIEASSYRLCYSFSAKGTLFNVLADSLKRDSDQRLAGWFFVGEGAGKQYAKDIAESMYCQFRLALCKAIAGTEKSLDDATYERTCLACSAMTGIVLLRNAGMVGNGAGVQEVGCLRYELHEFSFPLTKQKLRQEIKSRLKSNADMIDCDEVPSAGVNSAHLCPEVVDLISDDDEPIISLSVKKPASPQLARQAIPVDDDQPAISCKSAGGKKVDAECGRGSVETASTPANRVCDKHPNLDGDGLKPAYVDPALERQAEELWKMKLGYTRWAEETELCRKDPSRSRKLLSSLQEQRGSLYQTLCSASDSNQTLCSASYSNPSTVATVAVLNVAQASSSACGTSAEPVHRVQVDGATSASIRNENQRQQPSFCFAKLRVGQRPHAWLSSTSEWVGVAGEEGEAGEVGVAGEAGEAVEAGEAGEAAPAELEKETAAVIKGGEALEQQPASTPLASATPDGGKLGRRLHEYEEACNAHRSLFEQAHAKPQKQPQRELESGEIEAQGCRYLVENSVLVTILKLALSRSDFQSVHGILAGVNRGNEVVVSRALATDAAPPSSGGAQEDAAWVREQAQRLFPQARLLLPTPFPESSGDDVIVKEEIERGDVVMAVEESRQPDAVTDHTAQLQNHKGGLQVITEATVQAPALHTGIEEQAIQNELSEKVQKDGVGERMSSEYKAAQQPQILVGLQNVELKKEHVKNDAKEEGRKQGNEEVKEVAKEAAKAAAKEKAVKGHVKDVPKEVQHEENGEMQEDAKEVVKREFMKAQVTEEVKGVSAEAVKNTAAVKSEVHIVLVDGDTEMKTADVAASCEQNDTHGLVVLGYFHVSVASGGLEAGEQERRMLHALNGKGLGLACSVQEGNQVESSSDFVKFVAFDTLPQRASALQWKVLQEPFLPRRVLQDWWPDFNHINRGGGTHGAAAAHDAAAAAFVKVHTINLRIQEAYIKRQLALPSVTRLDARQCARLFLVGAPTAIDQVDAEQSGATLSSSPVSRKSDKQEYNANYDRSAGAPGWREYRLEDGRVYYYHPNQETTQWLAPAGWNPACVPADVPADKASPEHASANRSDLSVNIVTAEQSLHSVGAAAVSRGETRKARKPHTCSFCGQPKKGHGSKSCPGRQKQPPGLVQHTAPVHSAPTHMPPVLSYSFPQHSEQMQQYPMPFLVEKRSCPQETWPHR